MWMQGGPRASLEEEDVPRDLLYLGGWERGNYWAVCLVPAQGLGRVREGGLVVWRGDHHTGGHRDEGGRNPVDTAVCFRLHCKKVCVLQNYNWVWVLLNYMVVLVPDLLPGSMEVLVLDFWMGEPQVHQVRILAQSTFVQASHPGNLDTHQVPLAVRSRREVALDPAWGRG